MSKAPKYLGEKEVQSYSDCRAFYYLLAIDFYFVKLYLFSYVLVAPRPSNAVTSVINAPVSICGAVTGLFESLDTKCQ